MLAFSNFIDAKANILIFSVNPFMSILNTGFPLS